MSLRMSENNWRNAPVQTNQRSVFHVYWIFQPIAANPDNIIIEQSKCKKYKAFNKAKAAHFYQAGEIFDRFT